MRIASHIVALLVSVFLPALGWAGPPPSVATLEPAIRLPVVNSKGLRFSRLTTENGLSQTRVAQIVQDDQGFMWFGTQYGLNRYDGYDFKLFVHDPRHPESLGAVFVTALFKDRSGALWVAGPQTLDRFDARDETFEHIHLSDAADDRPPPTVVHISQDGAGIIWLATGAGLYRHDPVAGTIAQYGHDPDDPASLSSMDVRFSGEDREGNFWVGTIKGLDRFDRTTGEVTLHVPLPDPVQIGFFEDSLGNFWIIHASGDGLALFDRENETLTPYPFYDEPTAPSELTGVMGMVEDEAGALWIGSPGYGLLRLDREENRFVHYPHDPTDDTSIAEDKVIALFGDREGNIWAGHHSVGPSRFNPRPPLFETFRHDAGNPNSLEINFINAMLEDRSGALWIGNDLGLTRIDRRTGRYTRFREGLGRKPMVITIAEDHEGDIWIGTYGKGLARLDEASGTFTIFAHDPEDPGSLCNNQVHRLLITRDGTLWVGTDDGLCRLDADTGRFTTYKADWNDRRAQAYVSMAEDANGILWLGTHYSGLHRFDPATGEIAVFSAGEGPGDLRDNMIPTVHIDQHGAIWVGTQSGLDRFDPESGTFTPIYDNGPAPGRTISCILEDSEGTLWISSNQGLLHFDPRTGTFKTYTAVDGLPGNDLTGWGTGYEGPDGEMFFGGFAGGIAFFPERLVDTSTEPPVVLTDLQFPFLTPEEASAQRGDLAIGFSRGLSLDHIANSLSLTFSALSYINPPANRYRYKLEGLDDHWREVDSSQRVATFTTLPTGRYLFRAEGATARGEWSTPGIALPIRIGPAWWETWWFRGGMGLMALGLVYGGFRARLAELEGREREFRKLAENAPDMVMRFDSELRLRYANPAVRAFAGPHVDDLIGIASSAADHPLPVRLATVRRAMLTREPVSEEFELPHAGATADLEARIVPEYVAGRPARTVLVITRDITTRKRAEAALRKSEADLAHLTRVATIGELTTSIAHEVNQPLAAIVTNAEVALRWLAASPPKLADAATSVQRIVRDGRRAADIIARIAALVRKAEPAKVPLDLNAAILEVIPLVESQIAKAGVTLRLDLAAALPLVLADRVQIQQVVLNLVKNAIDAMDGAGVKRRVLEVSSASLGEAVEIMVRDTGPGLATGHEGNVFDAFFTTKAQGMGMGLAISRSIVESHGGRIWAEPGSERDGERGAVFKLKLPLE